ncbi:hypothetical protein CUMW_268200 [Citrus unshiu]|uniref:J domain-containing protein n=1 Tax=Citrus unshiu TaxID=55188 RepID=A0A2H5QXD8_CITUN|nr:hypothetical protein CUMW_268200 [Citrus unshiu]
MPSCCRCSPTALQFHCRFGKEQEESPCGFSGDACDGAEDGRDLYEVLRVEPTTTILEIKMAYQSLAKVYHLDLSGNGRDFIEIQNSYATLSDPTARAVYDMCLVSKRRTRIASFGCSGQLGFHPTRRWETD